MTDTKRIAAIARDLADEGAPNDLDVPPQPWEERRGLSAALGRLHARAASWHDLPAGKRATWAEHSVWWQKRVLRAERLLFFMALLAESERADRQKRCDRYAETARRAERAAASPTPPPVPRANEAFLLHGFEAIPQHPRHTDDAPVAVLTGVLSVLPRGAPYTLAAPVTVTLERWADGVVQADLPCARMFGAGLNDTDAIEDLAENIVMFLVDAAPYAASGRIGGAAMLQWDALQPLVRPAEPCKADGPTAPTVEEPRRRSTGGFGRWLRGERTRCKKSLGDLARLLWPDDPSTVRISDVERGLVEPLTDSQIAAIARAWDFSPTSAGLLQRAAEDEREAWRIRAEVLAELPDRAEALELKREVQMLRAHCALHPNGACTCHGEGTCTLCQLWEAQIELDDVRREDIPKIVELAVDSALGEVRRQGGPEYLLTEARTSGIDRGAFIAKALQEKREADGVQRRTAIEDAAMQRAQEACEGQVIALMPDDEYRRGQRRGALDCVEVIRRLRAAKP